VLKAVKIYFIKDRERKAFKVGLSSNPQARLEALQTGNPNLLVLERVIENGTRAMERALHKQFIKDRLRGEWFRYYDIGDEILVQGKAGNTACLVIKADMDGKIMWETKFNLRPDEKDRCIVELDGDGNAVPEF